MKKGLLVSLLVLAVILAARALLPAEFLRILFVAANVTLMSGHIFFATQVGPRLRLKLRRTQFSGAIFFASAGFTHADFAYHAALTGFTLDELLAWHLFVNHAIQAVALWIFATGIYKEFVVRPRTNPFPGEKTL